jgi:acetyltransferase-like isoleucine patch superfamily enzyme
MHWVMLRLRALGGLLADCWLGVIQGFPGRLGYRLRYDFWKRRLKHLGRNVKIERWVRLNSPELISIGDNSWIDQNVILLAGFDRSKRPVRNIEVGGLAIRGEIFIGRNIHVAPFTIVSGIEGGVHVGDDCSIASGSKIYALSHHYRFDHDPADMSCAFSATVEPSRQMTISGPVTLEQNVGIASNALILPGVRIGRNSFVAVGALLFNQEFPENSLIEGNPAKRKGPRFSNGVE